MRFFLQEAQLYTQLLTPQRLMQIFADVQNETSGRTGGLRGNDSLLYCEYLQVSYQWMLLAPRFLIPQTFPARPVSIAHSHYLLPLSLSVTPA
jgi:hypothetical protein